MCLNYSVRYLSRVIFKFHLRYSYKSISIRYNLIIGSILVPRYTACNTYFDVI